MAFLALHRSSWLQTQPVGFGIQLFQEAARGFGTLIN